MNTLLILILAVLLVAWAVVVFYLFRLADATLSVLKQVVTDYEDLRAETRLKQMAQDQRYHLMWDVRRLQEHQIFLLQRQCQALTTWVRGHCEQQPPEDGDWWKRGGRSGS